ncbi:hypothetical protein [Paenibacillus bouchesdurhonensis]
MQLSELAEVISVSPQYLCRLFQNTMQLRPMVYVNQQRINRSKQLMFSERDKKIYENCPKGRFREYELLLLRISANYWNEPEGIYEAPWFMRL